MKKLLAAILAGIMLLGAAGLTAAAEDFVLPAYESSQLSAGQLDEMFDPDGYTYPGAPHQDLVRAIYAKLDNPSKSVYGMNFTATETYEQASAAAYADYLVDFELCSNTPASVLLAGNYGEYGTIALGIVNITPEKPVRIMELVYQLIPDIKFTYKDIVLLVNSFDCAAIPVSPELLNAYYKVKCEEDPAYLEAHPQYTADVEAALLDELEALNPIEQEFIVAESGTTMNLDLKLYETDTELNETGNSWKVGETTSFTYTAEETKALPDYDSHILNKAELDALFAEKNFTDGVQKFVAQVYAKLSNPEKTAFGVNFKATETYEEADAARYSDYIADFALASDKPVSVLLAGNYGDYGTIALGVVNITPEPTRIMKLFDEVTGKGKLTYKEIVNLVGSFDCAAIPLSTEFLKAYYSAKCENVPAFKDAYPAYGQKAETAILEEFIADYNPAKAERFTVAQSDTSLTLSLMLYENDPASADKYAETGVSWPVGGNNAFTYEKAQTPDPVISKNLLIIHNMADVAKDGVFYHPVHIYTGIDTLDCDNVGLEIKVGTGGETEEQVTSTTTVYDTMNVTDSNGKASEYRADALGSTYIFGNQILLNAKKWTNENTTIFVTPYAVKFDGTIIKGDTTTITDALIKEKNQGSNLFKEEQ